MTIAAHFGSWSVEDVLALPEDTNRYEVVDGALIVNPPPGLPHQRASRRLANILEQAGRGEVWEAVGVQLAGGTMLIPDLVVARPGFQGHEQALLAARDVLLAAEIVSPGSITRDRTEKPYLYAQAGIPYFWRVELGHYKGRTMALPVVHAYRLAGPGGEGAEYEPLAVFGAGMTVSADPPFPVRFDPADLR